MRSLAKFNVFFHRVVNVEFWPFWIFYGPFIPIFLYYGVKNGNILHFLSVNPGIKNSGCFNFSKFEILDQLPPKYLPKTTFLPSETAKEFKYKEAGFEFPFIVKPDRGSRGRGVMLVKTVEELNPALNKNYDLIIQEYIDYPFEFGIFYFHNQQTGDRGITGITSKEFLTIFGDGKKTLGDLIENHPRSTSNLSHFREKFSSEWQRIIPANEEVVIEEIGAHNRGTKCIDSSSMITEKMQSAFFDLADHIDDFYWGRIDVKARSKEDLSNGEHFQVIEVNGGSSEPSHMFDPKYNWFDVAKFITQHLKLHYGVVKANIEHGAQIPSLQTFYDEIKHYFNNKKLQIK
mgnify:CR=1 FL=1